MKTRSEYVELVPVSDMLAILEGLSVSEISNPRNWIDLENNFPYFESAAQQQLARSAPLLQKRIASYSNDFPEMLHIRGLIGKRSKVPTFYDGIIKAELIWEELIAFIGCLCSLELKIVGYSRKNNGRLLRSVAPTVKGILQLGSQGSARELPMHVDNADLLFPREYSEIKSGPKTSARYLAWLVLNAEPDVPIEYVRLEDAILLHPDKEDIGWLSAPLFDVSSPDSISDGRVSENLKILVQNEIGQFVSRFNQAKISSKNLQAQLAFDRFIKTVNDPRIRKTIHAQRGDIILLDNFRCVHGRRKFLSRDDGTDRQMIRVYAMQEQEFQKVAADYLSPKHSSGRIFSS
ncbi:MAG TPA: TauD/TfdA family dioxygenase [Pyrinomonadaceae bacterium]|nr:TauD/TfdA family dioxygenase [Pyrinomonadaceae bacterium]